VIRNLKKTKISRKNKKITEEGYVMEYLIEPLNSRNSKDIVKPDSVQVDPGPVMGCSIYYCPVD